MLNNNFQANQTQFATQEPILENAPLANENLKSEEQKELSYLKKKKKLILVGIMGLVLIIVFILLLVLLRLNSNEKKQTEKTEKKMIVQEIGESGPLLKEVYELKVNLKSADPSLNPLPFPPLDMNLRLESKKR